jgi:hypothetical protein
MSWRTAAPLAMVVALVLAIAGGSGGCSAGAAAAKGGPRDRIGALPFPGAFTLYRPADPENLGRHRYERTPRWFHPDESSGIVYTTRAGFLDLAHVRITIDAVRFCTRQVRAAIAARRDLVTLPTIEGSAFIVTLRTPSDLSNAGGNDVADELAIRIGQRLGYLMMTWHEMITWFGYRTILFIDESPSAFTYDDTMSHVVGLRVAGRALRDRSGRSFDDSATTALHKELAALGAVTPGETERAARAVEGLWWSRGKPLKRHLEIGLLDDTIRPWLIPGLHLMRDTEPESFRLPTLDDVFGHDYRGLYSVRIDPGVRMAERIRRELPPAHPTLLEADRDFPVLLEIVRSQMQHRLRPDVDQPWPALAARTTKTTSTTRPGLAIDSQQPLTAARPTLHRRANGVAVSGSVSP